MLTSIMMLGSNALLRLRNQICLLDLLFVAGKKAIFD
jgi:hypothetical protein